MMTYVINAALMIESHQTIIKQMCASYSKINLLHTYVATGGVYYGHFVAYVYMATVYTLA